MVLLSFALLVVAIFVGQFKGAVLWGVGTLALIYLSGTNPALPYEGHGLPILLGIVCINLLSIFIGRWWGLLFNLVASVVLVGMILI